MHFDDDTVDRPPITEVVMEVNSASGLDYITELCVFILTDPVCKYCCKTDELEYTFALK